MQLAKSFDHKEFEDRIYALWRDGGYFAPVDRTETHAVGDRVERADEDSPAEDLSRPFVIVIPPPNVTGVLHMGHGLNNSLQDVLVRYYRMRGRKTLWVPGTDHAGIATQNVVERKLREEGKERREMGREAFLEETWKVKEDHHATITRQLEKIGASCDWSRERFTMDERLSRAVIDVFVSLYERGLIYRGNYLVNWCSSCGTALSDDEVEHAEVQGKLYRYYYPTVEGDAQIEIATTRPETMLGDTAVAVHPDDKRYTAFHGRQVKLPLTDRTIPVITDEWVDTEFGSGAVKVTPAHDPNDREMGYRHDLDEINILNPDGTLNKNVPERYQGLTVQQARKKVVADLEESGLYIDAKEHVHQVGHCYRCDTIIEPYLSEQWFVKMRPLAEKAMNAWKRKEVVFFPQRWENTYTNWLENIRDWCISRQLWWGHRIPVWYDQDTGEMIVSRTDPTEEEEHARKNLVQDEDVLDTWFSSWLWPFSTLGWPEDTEDLRTFFPTTTLVTAYDIIFFWVARMIMASMEFMGQAPFHDIFITGLIRDKQGRKMSKSLGNGIDPLEIVDEYGADSLRFTLSFLAARGQDILLEKADFNFGSKFCNKIWNACRYILMNLEGRRLRPLEELELSDTDRWIYHELNESTKIVRAAMASYRFSDASKAVYEFFWNEFCDWYVEASKLSLYSEDEAEKDLGISLLIHVLEESLRLMHPFLPFITEEIYQKLPAGAGEQAAAPGAQAAGATGADIAPRWGYKRGEALIASAFPSPHGARETPEVASKMESLKELVRVVRTLRSEFTIPPGHEIKFHVKAEADFQARGFIEEHLPLIEFLTGSTGVAVMNETPDTAGSIPAVGTGFEAYVYIKEAIDVEKEIARLEKSAEKQRKVLAQAEKKLENPGFLNNAGEEVVQKEREKRDELARKIEKMESYVAELKR
jgi:valyl-tRNA synthetase